MKVTRRQCIAVAAGALAQPALTRAQAVYPSRPVKLIAPSVPGGAVDIIARIAAGGLSRRWPQPVVVENKPGAGTSLGTDFVAKSQPDGYTLLLAGIASHAINPVVYKKIGYDPIKDFSPIALMATLPNVILVRPDHPASSLKDLLALIQRSSERQIYASVGNGTSPHLSAELLWQMVGVKVDHVPYKGSAPGITDLLAGQIPVLFDNISGGLPFVRDGRLRALAVTSARRTPLLPSVPTVAESGVSGYEITAWSGLCGPAGLPRGVVEKVSMDILSMLREPDIAKQLLEAGATVRPMPPAEFGQFIVDQATKFRVIAHRANLQIT